jgi:hypothetical protein
VDALHVVIQQAWTSETQHYQDGFQSGKSKTDQLFALRQILEKCNEFNIMKSTLVCQSSTFLQN